MEVLLAEMRGQEIVVEGVLVLEVLVKMQQVQVPEPVAMGLQVLLTEFFTAAVAAVVNIQDQLLV
jgi:hypothetical protein